MTSLIIDLNHALNSEQYFIHFKNEAVKYLHKSLSTNMSQAKRERKVYSARDGHNGHKYTQVYPLSMTQIFVLPIALFIFVKT